MICRIYGWNRRSVLAFDDEAGCSRDETRFFRNQTIGIDGNLTAPRTETAVLDAETTGIDAEVVALRAEETMPDAEETMLDDEMTGQRSEMIARREHLIVTSDEVTPRSGEIIPRDGQKTARHVQLTTLLEQLAGIVGETTRSHDEGTGAVVERSARDEEGRLLGAHFTGIDGHLIGTLGKSIGSRVRGTLRPARQRGRPHQAVTRPPR
jgi:hypothetical protein